jgi:CRP-like cAMP-binding protein/class 3 adenylate cyclase
MVGVTAVKVLRADWNDQHKANRIMARKVKASAEKQSAGGNFAVLGMDIVAFSKLHDDDQITAIEHLSRWIERALAYYGISAEEYRWSPAGDGGYLTFVSTASSRHAIDVAFSILEKAKRSEFCPRNSERLQLRLALHSGTVREGYELGRASNIWGMGINMAARVLSVTTPSQLLVSKQYYDTYIMPDRKEDFTFGSLYRRTVKHKAYVEVMNAGRGELGLTVPQADDRRWQNIGGLWEKTRREYEFLIHDAMHSGQPIAAVAAAKFLLDLEIPDPVSVLCGMIGDTQELPTKDYPPQKHDYLSKMTPEILLDFISTASARPMRANSVICKQGDPASSCFFTVAGTVELELPDRQIRRLPPGSIVGEFGLWIENIPRTGTVTAKDDGLMLCFQLDSFKDLMAKAPHVANLIYGTVRNRVLENVLKHERLFPVEYAKLTQILGKRSSCDKYARDVELDLTASAYVIFSGSVQIEPAAGISHCFSATGDISKVPVVGILSSIGCPDGTTATVLEEAVAVRIGHDALRDLQKLPAVKQAWDALYGQRLGEIQEVQETPTAG